MTRDDVLKRLRDLKPELAREASVRAIAVFGSVARDQAHEGSDVDLIVEFERTPDYFTFVDLQDRLSADLGAKVDLFTKNGLHPALKEGILREAIYA